jgi:hypothetical protein
VLGTPNKRDDVVTVSELLGDLSRRLGGRLAPDPVGSDPAVGWVGLDEMLDDDGCFPALARAAGSRFMSDDLALVGAQLVREWVSTITEAAVTMWGLERRLFDWTAGNVAVRTDGSRTVGLRRLDLLVLPSEGAMVDALLERALGRSLPAGVAAVVTAARRAVRSGDRHYWGTAGLAVANALTAVSHEVGARADRDRALLLGRRPDLARTVEVLTVDDGLGTGDTVSCARRLTCCLLVKLPGGVQCGTCNLRDRDECVASLAAWARAERRASRRSAAARLGELNYTNRGHRTS